jgi:hypothetical protein
MFRLQTHRQSFLLVFRLLLNILSSLVAVVVVVKVLTLEQAVVVVLVVCVAQLPQQVAVVLEKQGLQPQALLLIQSRLVQAVRHEAQAVQVMTGQIVLLLAQG